MLDQQDLTGNSWLWYMQKHFLHLIADLLKTEIKIEKNNVKIKSKSYSNKKKKKKESLNINNSFQNLRKGNSIF